VKDDDGLATGALFVGGGIAGYALGRWVIARWLGAQARPATTTAAASATPSASLSTPAATPPPAQSTATALTSTAPPGATSAPQARSSPLPRKPRPAPRPTEPEVGPLTSPTQVEPSEPEVGPMSSPAQVEPSASPPRPADEPVTSPAQAEQPRTAPTLTIVPFPTGSAHYDARASRLIASIPKRAARTRELIAQWPAFLDRYRGGLPRGVFAAVMQMESNGHLAAKGDPRLGEVGLFQITEEFPRSLGLDPRLRYETEWNFYFAGVEYNQAAARWSRRYRSLIEDGSKDAWLLARLSFAIGDAGARNHVERALDAHPDVARRDGLYAALDRLVRQGSATKAGAQSPALVAYRIGLVCPVNFEIGEIAEPGRYGVPVKLSPPTDHARRI